MVKQSILILSLAAYLTSCGNGHRTSMHNDTIPPEGAENTNGALLHWATLPIKLKIDPSFTELQRNGLLSAIKTWEDAVGLNLIDIDGFDNANVNPEGPTFILADNTNGAYMISDWANMKDKAPTVLAVTTWKTYAESSNVMFSADLMYNETYYNWVDTLSLTAAKADVDFETVSLHELGHFLGIPHTSENEDPDSIMNPTIQIGAGQAYRTLSATDIRNIRARYGCAEYLKCKK